MHDSYYSDNDIDRILYQYYKANGGCLMYRSVVCGSCYYLQFKIRLRPDLCCLHTGRAYISVPPGFTSLYGITKRRRYDNKAGDQSALP